jgi:hypothetical protein
VFLAQQGGELEDGGDHVAGRDDAQLGLGLKAPARKGEQQVTGEREQQRVQRNARGEYEVLVRCADPGREPREADRHHQRARAVSRPPPPREQPRPDERPADQQPNQRRHPAVVGVVALEHKHEERQPRGEPRAGKCDQRQPQRGQ